MDFFVCLMRLWRTDRIWDGVLDHSLCVRGCEQGCDLSSASKVEEVESSLRWSVSRNAAVVWIVGMVSVRVCFTNVRAFGLEQEGVVWRRRRVRRTREVDNFMGPDAEFARMILRGAKNLGTSRGIE